jgi:putative peptidoglycan lipid II flippase
MVLALRRDGFPLALQKPSSLANLKALWLLAVPMLGSNLIANANILVDQVMATLLADGAVSTLRYAYRVNDLPIQIVIIAFTLAIFPYISQEAACGNYDNLRKMYKNTLIFLAFLTLPIIAFVNLGAGEIIALLFQRGAFDAQATQQTAATLICYSWGLFFYAYTYINGSFFAALKRTKTLFNLGLLSIFLNAFLNYIFMNLIGVQGIALSTTVTLGTMTVFFMVILKKCLQIPDLASLLPTFAVILLGTAAMGVVGYPLMLGVREAAWNPLGVLPLMAAVTGLVYGGVVWFFRTPDLDAGYKALMAWWHSRKS